jgi:hypothetical protein
MARIERETRGRTTDDRWERIAALTGVAVGVLFVTIILVAGEVPEAPAPGREVSAFFAEHRSTLSTVAFLEGLAAVAMLWFWGVLRSVLARAEGGQARLANVVLAAGAGVALLYLLSGAFWGTLAYHSVSPADPDTAALLYQLGAVTFQGRRLPLGGRSLRGRRGRRPGAGPAFLAGVGHRDLRGDRPDPPGHPRRDVWA